MISRVATSYYLKCPVFNKWLWDMQLKRKAHIQKKKLSIETAPEETQMVHLLDKNFKLPTLNGFKN